MQRRFGPTWSCVMGMRAPTPVRTAAGIEAMKILVIEDDRRMGAYVRKGLEEHGHVVDLAPNGRDGLFLAAGETYDVMIVDPRRARRSENSTRRRGENANPVSDHDGGDRRPRGGP